MTAPLELGRLALGTVPLGNFRTAITDDQAGATVDAAWHVGIRTFDTAPLYGSGLAETRLGRALAGRPRDEYVLCSKVGNTLVPGGRIRDDLLDAGRYIYRDVPHLAPTVDFRPDAVLRQLDDSLTRLGVDRIDLVHLHDPAPGDPGVAAAFDVLAGLRQEGVITGIGIGGSDPAAIEELCAHHDIDVVLVASVISMLEHRDAERILAAAASAGAAVIAAGVFNSGILAAADPSASTYGYRAARPETVTRVARIRALCAAHGVDPVAAAIGYPLRDARVGTVLVGAASPGEITADARAMEAVIPDDFWRDVDALDRIGTEDEGDLT